MSLMFKKVQSTLHFDKENPKVIYKLANQRQSKVSFNQLLNDVHRSSGVNRAQTQAVIEGLIDSLSHFIDLGHTVQMGGFGTLRPHFTTKAQDTMDAVCADNVVRCKIQFYPGAVLKATMRNIKLEDAEPEPEETEQGSESTNTNTNVNTGDNTGNGNNGEGGGTGGESDLMI